MLSNMWFMAFSVNVEKRKQYAYFSVLHDLRIEKSTSILRNMSPVPLKEGCLSVKGENQFAAVRKKGKRCIMVENVL